MDSSLPILSFAGAAVMATAAAYPKLRARLALSRAKHGSLTGHSKMSRRVARLIPFYEFDINDFFRSDGAPAEVATRRQDGFFRLAQLYRDRFARSREMTLQASEKISDLQFTEAYRVPFQYSRLVREHLGTGAFVQSSAGVTVTDLDGNTFYDLTGSYGVNIFGNDFYKECIAKAEARAHALGPVLGPYHPVIVENVARLCGISGLDEVSFNMSGTEAVMQAVRLARYHTRRSHLVRFAGAYHGWWGDVQPGVGNPISPHETYTLADMSERTLRVLKTRRDIACVLINPLQALHPNAGAPADSALADSSRRGHFDRAAYSAWLQALRQVCTERGIVLIFDEVFVGFRLAAGGAQEYFGVRDDSWNARARQLNDMLAAHDLPVRVSNLSSIWMVHYTEPSRYNWMFQYYLRAERLALSWVGTGRLIFSLNYTDADFAEVAKRFVDAAEKMKRDGWWWRDASLTNKNIRRQILKEMLTRRRPR